MNTLTKHHILEWTNITGILLFKRENVDSNTGPFENYTALKVYTDFSCKEPDYVFQLFNKFGKKSIP